MAEPRWWSDMFAPLIEVGKWVWAIIPKRLRPGRPRFNYITVHYCYIIGSTIILSVILYAYGNLAYIDALFFASGTATQSGLNTVDVNNLKTYQQVIFALGSCLCTPIWINTVVVFVRLYWFEKRFEHIVKESRLQRRTRTISRSKSQMRDENLHDLSAIEKGVRGREIKLLPETLKGNGMTKATPRTEEALREFRKAHGLSPVEEPTNETASSSSTANSSREQAEGIDSDETVVQHLPKSLQVDTTVQTHLDDLQDSEQRTLDPSASPRLTRGITFADEVLNDGRQSPELARIPDQKDLSKHIEFLQRQQANAKQGGAYYIPGPRDFEEGRVPEQLGQDDMLQRQITSNSQPSRRESVHGGSVIATSVDDGGLDIPGAELPRRGITIDEPGEHPGHRGRALEDVDTSSHRGRSRGGLVRRRSFGTYTLSEAGRGLTRTFTNITRHRSGEREATDPMPYFSWEATTGRNSTFLGLTQEQREELGGIEYRSLKTLCGILLCYYFGFHLLGWIVYAPWITQTQRWKSVIVDVGQSPVWWGLFTPISLFNDVGFTLTPDSMYSFDESVLVLLFGSFLIIIGNTGFPVMLRFIIWVSSKIASTGSPIWEELRFLLDHPRRCFTLLFPSKATWWLFWVLVLLNGIDLIFFIILDLGESSVTDLHVGYRILNGWFLAVSTRTAGFSSVNIANLHAAIQVSYLIMMYISIFPIAISVRRTNVYEEKSLGIFGGEEVNEEDEPSYVSQHLRRQLSFDLWYIFLGLFVIAIVEGDRIANTNQYAFTTFSVLFEIVSAYGTVGLSLGYPTINASFSAEFRPLSKLIIIAMMIRGRHRGLPYALDRAILLPSEKLQQKEAEDAARREQRRRRGSVFAEGASEFTRSKTWEEGDLDEYGLPRQHATGVSALLDPMATGASMAEPPGLLKVNTRRSAAMSTQGDGKSRQRSRSLGRLVASSLSAGPTFSKRD